MAGLFSPFVFTPFSSHITKANPEKEDKTPEPKTYDLPNGSSGMSCKTCKIIFSYVEPNQKDKTYICYSCREVWE